jgi:hypothetical protein
MSPKRKSAGKPRRKIRNVSLREFEAMINEFGHIEEGSKHPKAIISNYTLPYKREKTIKACYVKDLYDIIDSL